MRILIIGVTLLSAAAVWGREPGSRVQYIGGTVYQDTRQGVMFTTDERFFEFRSLGQPLRIDYEKIEAIEYGQKADRRYAMAVLISPVFLLSKRRQHFLTVHYLDENGHSQALLFKVDKDRIRAALVSLEARTGKKVQYQDDEARKAGKG